MNENYCNREGHPKCKDEERRAQVRENLTHWYSTLPRVPPPTLLEAGAGWQASAASGLQQRCGRAGCRARQCVVVGVRAWRVCMHDKRGGDGPGCPTRGRARGVLACVRDEACGRGAWTREGRERATSVCAGVLRAWACNEHARGFCVHDGHGAGGGGFEGEERAPARSKWVQLRSAGRVREGVGTGSAYLGVGGRSKGGAGARKSVHLFEISGVRLRSVPGGAQSRGGGAFEGRVHGPRSKQAGVRSVHPKWEVTWAQHKRGCSVFEGGVHAFEGDRQRWLFEVGRRARASEVGARAKRRWAFAAQSAHAFEVGWNLFENLLPPECEELRIAPGTQGGETEILSCDPLTESQVNIQKDCTS
ncbi:hypothetical protein K438DRAFT_1938780 [Mycena galopus ATCC 62051]|nr:hypothetical protein K438DRAFT_1938780 [Mycena galopus ATCC 62051]